MKIDCEFLTVMKNHLVEKGKLIQPTQAQLDRLSGKTLSFFCHIKYVIYALLSNQEKWSNIEKHISEIDDVFFQYDVNRIKEHSWDYFYNKLKNKEKPLIVRGVLLKEQMQSLHKNIETLESIEKKVGLDNFVISKSPREIVESFTSQYKLKYMGVSLICEYLKNVGVQCAKPDIHVMRFLSKTRRGFLKKDEAYCSKKDSKLKDTSWTDKEKIDALKIIEDIGGISGKTPSDIDRVIWSYCADGYGKICTKIPNCKLCCVPEGCHRNEPGVRF